MTETFTAVEIARDTKEASISPRRVQQAGCCGRMRPDQRTKWQSAVLAELAEPGYPERLSNVTEFVAQAQFERPATTRVKI